MAQPAPLREPMPFGRFSPRQAIVCGVLALLLDVTIGAYRLDEVVHGALLNPDSYMRLVRLNDILAAHAPIDVVQMDGSGAGTILYWSHLLDSLLLLLAAPLAPFLGEHDALRWAGVLLGPLSAGLLGVALAWAAAPLSDPAWQWTAALIGAAAVPIFAYAVPGVVHHHILVALCGTMCAGWAGRVHALGGQAGARLAAWTAFGLWLSPEVMPIALMAFGAIGLGWLLHPDEPNWGSALACATTALALLVAVVLAVDPPQAGLFAPELDRLSFNWLILTLLGAATAWSLSLLDRKPLSSGWRGLLGAMLAATAAGIWLALFPDASLGTEGVVHGADPATFFDDIAEMRPVGSFADAITFLLFGAFAATVATILAILRRSLLLGYVATCLLLLLLAAALHRRFSTYTACAGAIAVPVAITLISDGLRSRPVVLAAASRLSLLLFLLIAPFAAQRPTAKAGPKGTCSIQQAAPLLRQFAGRVVLADVNDTPELLYRTGLLTVGSLYHSNAAAYLRLRAAWRSQDLDHVPLELTATHATLLLFCRHAARSAMVANLPTGTLWDRLSHDDPPPWLHEIHIGPESGYRLFRLD